MATMEVPQRKKGETSAAPPSTAANPVAASSSAASPPLAGLLVRRTFDVTLVLAHHACRLHTHAHTLHAVVIHGTIRLGVDRLLDPRARPVVRRGETRGAVHARVLACAETSRHRSASERDGPTLRRVSRAERRGGRRGE